MGDIGCPGTKANGEDAYHVFVGGGFGKHQSVGRQIFAGMSATNYRTLWKNSSRSISTTTTATKHFTSLPCGTKFGDCRNCLLNCDGATPGFLDQMEARVGIEQIIDSNCQ
jgi:hypothetical protein